MKTKLIKIVMLIVTLMVLFSNSYVFAEDPPPDTNPITNPGYYQPDTDSENSTTLIAMVGGVLGVIQTVGIVCSVIVLCVIGLKYMVGSVEQKAEYKKTMLGYIIGVALLVSATTLPNMLYEFLHGQTGPTYSYDVVTGSWYWCENCDRELTEGEKRSQSCDINRSHEITVRTERYYCKNCGDEWDEGERRQQGCDQCRSK